MPIDLSVSSLIANLSLFIPMVTIAGSAVAYLVRLNLDAKIRRRDDFYAIMEMLDSNSPLASKLAAIYRLREFPEDRAFVVRFCNSLRGNISGPATEALIRELDATVGYFDTARK